MAQLDDLFEQSPYIQKKKEEGREIGMKEGREIARIEGHQRGLVVGLQKAFVTIVQGRFPPLAKLAQQGIVQITKPDQLDLLLKEIVYAPDEATALWILSTIAAS